MGFTSTRELSAETRLKIDAFERLLRMERRVKKLEAELSAYVLPADEVGEYVRITEAMRREDDD